MTDPLLFAFGVGMIAILVATYITRWILKRDSGTARMREVSKYIVIGTNAYLKRQLRTIILVIPWLAIIILFFFNWTTSLAFVCGVFLSLLAGYVGMNVAVRANVRTASAATRSLGETLRTGFLGGSVMGLAVPGISLVALFLLRMALNDISALVGFGFGASLAALFAQIGGGIFTKAADIGADLVGKVEMEIPEDDPRNPAVIADLVGDNVGDCAGRGSDLFQTFSDDIITGMLMGVLFISRYGPNGVVFPFILEAVGVLASMFGISLVRRWRRISSTGSLVIGLMVTAVLGLIGMFFLSTFFLYDVSLFFAGLLGVSAVLVCVLITLYYTGLGRGPVHHVAESSQAGPAINLITGISTGLATPLFPMIAVLAAVVVSFIVTGQSLYGIVITNIGTDMAIAFIMASDTFGPITDNAAGIAEMSGISGQASETLNSLDAVGNTMKASTKGYAMASGTVTSFLIFATFFATANISVVSLASPYPIAALFLGVVLPLPLASLTIRATSDGAFKMVDEARRQFKEIIGLKEGKATPDYAKCIDIATKNALSRMVLPGLISVATPIVVGLLFGPTELGMLLIGATASAAMLGFFFNNTGALLDNAKKLVESGLYGGKKSDTHKATVIGDTVGDPLKDVAGPSVLIFMKLIGMTALLMLPILTRI
jgi:K(+)-stimulated pyrophosphate-energized sodium pump